MNNSTGDSIVIIALSTLAGIYFLTAQVHWKYLLKQIRTAAIQFSAGCRQNHRAKSIRNRLIGISRWRQFALFQLEWFSRNVIWQQLTRHCSLVALMASSNDEVRKPFSKVIRAVPRC